MLKFLTGNRLDAYDMLGAHKAKNGYDFYVYAPAAKEVSLIYGETESKIISMKKSNTGLYSLNYKDAKNGASYGYLITDSMGKTVRKADPFGRYMKDGWSVLFESSFSFTDQDWMEERKDAENKPMHIYEVHAGSFRKHEDDRFLSYKELGDVLIPWVKARRFTHVEFLPLMEHPYLGSWGYQLTGYFAPASRYGSPDELKALVNRLHEEGIGVIFDFVPVHFALDSYGLISFDGSPIFEYPDKELAINEWGSVNFNYYSPVTQSFLKSAAFYWIKEFHADGLRIDAVSNMIYWNGDRKRGVNEGALSLIRDLNDLVHRQCPDVYMIAEDSTAFPDVTRPVKEGGLGFDYKWDMGWMHDSLNFFSLSFWDRKARYQDLLFSMKYFYKERYLLPFSHDEVVHGKRSIIDRMFGGYPEKFAGARVLYSYMMTHPGKKLNFMGNEFGQFREWDEKREQDFELLKRKEHKAFLNYFDTLNQIYQKYSCLYEEEYDKENFTYLVGDDPDRLIYAYERIGDRERILTILNVSDEDQMDYEIKLPVGKKLILILNSDDKAFGGKGRSVKECLTAYEKTKLCIPSNSALIYLCMNEK